MDEFLSMKKLKCPDCGGDLIKKGKLAEGVFICSKCKNVWLIINIRKRK